MDMGQDARGKEAQETVHPVNGSLVGLLTQRPAGGDELTVSDGGLPLQGASRSGAFPPDQSQSEGEPPPHFRTVVACSLGSAIAWQCFLLAMNL